MLLAQGWVHPRILFILASGGETKNVVSGLELI
jgi:hypothetical protein